MIADENLKHVCAAHHWSSNEMDCPLCEQQLADLFKERLAFELKRGNGITLEKNEYIGGRIDEIEKKLSELKTKKDGLDRCEDHTN